MKPLTALLTTALLLAGCVGGGGFTGLRPLALFPVTPDIDDALSFSPSGNLVGRYTGTIYVAYAPNGTFQILSTTGIPVSTSINDARDTVFSNGTFWYSKIAGVNVTGQMPAPASANEDFVISSDGDVYSTIKGHATPAAIAKKNGSTMAFVDAPNLGGHAAVSYRFMAALNDNSIILEVNDAVDGMRYFQRAASGTYTEFTNVVAGRALLDVRDGLELAMTDTLSNPTSLIIRKPDGTERTYTLPAGSLLVNTAGQFDDETVFAGIRHTSDISHVLPYVWRLDGTADWLQNVVPSSYDGYTALLKVTDSGAYVSEANNSTGLRVISRFTPQP